jgi:hypothetical protein
VPNDSGHSTDAYFNKFLEKTINEIGNRALERLAQTPLQWGVISMLDDVDRLPAIFKIPKRDPSMNYKCTIRKKQGRRVPLLHCWPKRIGPIEPKVKRSKIEIGDPLPILDGPGFDQALAEYESARAIAAAAGPNQQGSMIEP